MEDIQANNQELAIPEESGMDEDESQPLVLTKRDIAIFRLMHEHRYLAFNQIRRAFWKDRSDIAKAAYRRVTRLVKAGYLEMGFSKRKRLDLYLLTDQALQELQRQGMDLGLGRYRITEDIERHIDHDLKVTNLRILFREMGFENWTPERILKEVRHERHVPDGIINLRGRRIAIEFENVLKVKARYKDNFDRYASNADYFLLIMIVYENLRDWLVDMDYNPEQVWFVEYQELMQKQDQVLLENKHNTFLLGRLL